MRITPLEIRQKEFEKNFRGYDKDEVNAFLQTLSQEWERMLEENRDMRFRLESAQKEVDKLREVESSLFKTLKTAEDTGASMIDQANKTAELRIREANIKAEEMLSEARIRAKSIVEKAEGKSHQIIEEMHARVLSLQQNYKETQEEYDSLISKLKDVATDILEKVEATEEIERYDVNKKVEEAEQLVEEYGQTEREKKDGEGKREIEESENKAQAEVQENEEELDHEWEPEVVDKEADSPKEAEHKPRKSKSFFDEIE